MSIFLYNFTYIYFIWTVTHQFFLLYLSKKHLDHSITKNQKILWIRNGHFHQINASNNVFSFIDYINFVPKCDFPLILKFWAWNAGDSHFFIFLFGRAYYKEVIFKKLKKICVLSYADEYHYQYYLDNQWMPSSDLHWMKRGLSIH